MIPDQGDIPTSPYHDTYMPFALFTTTHTWFPFMKPNIREYQHYCYRYAHYIPKDGAGNSTEIGYRAILKYAVLASPHVRHGTNTASGAWGKYMMHIPEKWDLQGTT